MASRRIAKTRSLGSYLSSVDQASRVAFQNIDGANTLATNSIGEASIQEDFAILDKSIQSGNYVEGYSGWMITGAGDAEFGNVVVRGDINASSGTIGYWNISTPAVSRVIGTKNLLGTFLESSAAGSNDIDVETGSYVGLYKSYSPDPVELTLKARTSNVATLTSPAHEFVVGDLVVVNIEDAGDTTFNNGGIAVTITGITTDTFSYANTGSDVPEAETVGEAQLYNPDEAGLYLRDYSRTEFDYGYFSNKGLAYVSAAKLNAIKNPSFDFAPVLSNTDPGTGAEEYYVGSFYSDFSYDSSAWESTSLSTANKTSVNFFNATPKYNSDSAYGTLLAWSSTAPGSTEYYAARVDYTTSETYTMFSGGKILNFNFDSFFYQSRPKLSVTGVTGTSTTMTATTSSAHGLAVGDIVFLAFNANDTSFDNFAKSTFNPFPTSLGIFGQSFTVTAVTSTTFSYANPIGTAPAGSITLTTSIEPSVIRTLSTTYNEAFITLGVTQNNIYRTSDAVTVTLSGSETRFNGSRTVTSAYQDKVVFANPTLKSVTNKVITSNVMTITTSAAHGYAVNDVVELVDVDKAINISSVAIASNVVTLVVASAHQLVVGEPVKISGLTQLGADYDNLSWTTTTGTTGTTIKFLATEWITAGLSNLSTTSVSGPTARPEIFDGTWEVLGVGSTTFTITFNRANYTTTAVTSAYSGVITTIEDAVTLNVGEVLMSGTNAYEAFSPVLDLTKAKVQYGNDTTKTTSLYAVVASTDLSNWANKRQRSMSADAYMLSLFGLAVSSVDPIPLLDAVNTSNIKLDGKKIYDYYASLNPDGQAAGEDLRILFPAKLYAGTVTGTYSVDGDGSVTNSALVTSSGSAYTGYILDNVHLSTASEYFDGNSGVEEYSWSGTADSTANHSSVKDSKHWLDIDLDTQAARIEVDYVGINENSFTKRLFRNAFIGNIDPNNVETEIYALGYTGATDIATITVSSGEYEVINGDQHTYLKTYLTNYVGATETGFEIMAVDKTIDATDAQVTTNSRVGIEGHVYAGGSAEPFSEMHLFSDTTYIGSTNNRLTFADVGLTLDSGQLRLPALDIAGLSEAEAPIQIGSEFGVNTIIGDREIQTRNSGNASSFYVNFYGGSVVIGNTTVGLGKIDGTSDYVWANGVYGNVLTTSYRSVYVSSSGTYDELGYVASSRRFKKNIEPLSYTAEQILSVRTVEYHYNEEDDSSPKHVGMIAEEMHDAGLHGFISYDKEGLPETIQYEFYVTALQQVVRDQANKISDLTSRIEALESR